MKFTQLLCLVILSTSLGVYGMEKEEPTTEPDVEQTFGFNQRSYARQTRFGFENPQFTMNMPRQPLPEEVELLKIQVEIQKILLQAQKGELEMWPDQKELTKILIEEQKRKMKEDGPIKSELSKLVLEQKRAELKGLASDTEIESELKKLLLHEKKEELKNLPIKTELNQIVLDQKKLEIKAQAKSLPLQEKVLELQLKNQERELQNQLHFVSRFGDKMENALAAESAHALLGFAKWLACTIYETVNPSPEQKLLAKRIGVANMELDLAKLTLKSQQRQQEIAELRSSIEETKRIFEDCKENSSPEMAEACAKSKKDYAEFVSKLRELLAQNAMLKDVINAKKGEVAESAKEINFSQPVAA